MNMRKIAIAIRYQFRIAVAKIRVLLGVADDLDRLFLQIHRDGL